MPVHKFGPEDDDPPEGTTNDQNGDPVYPGDKGDYD